MGIHLRPGHKPENGKKGFSESGYVDFVDDVKVSNIDLGYWGRSIDKNINAMDAHSPIYSIPNPWAATYLYNYVLGDNTHPLANYLIIQILNLLSDHALHGKLELIQLGKPEPDSPFKNIWMMIPQFIKYDDHIWLFKDRSTNEIVGGLSKSSLVWTSQQYEGNRNEQELKSDNKLRMYLKMIKEKKSPSFENYDAFWRHGFIVMMIDNVNEDKRVSFATIANMPEDCWLRTISWVSSDSTYRYHAQSEELDCLIISEEVLNNGKQIFNDVINPSGFIEELSKLKRGEKLPMKMGDIKWVVIDSLLEPYWINNDKVESSDPNLVQRLEKGFLYPVKPEFITKYKLKLKDLKIVDTINKGSSNAKASLNWKGKLKMELNTNFHNDTRSIGIWPPFNSQYFSNYIIEYNISEGIQTLEILQFFDENGIEITSKCNYHPGQNFRIYELLEKKFPQYIYIRRNYNDQSFGGFIEISPKRKGIEQGNIYLGIDFGTSHTSIYYRKDTIKDKILFDKSSPITITDEQSRSSFMYNFLPSGLATTKPKDFNEWDKKIPWQPFQTQWMAFNEGNLKSEPTVDGVIPFLHYLPDTSSNEIYSNLKWGAEKNISTYRELFLKQLLMMAIVEAEAIGFKDLFVNWSYPKSYSVDGQLKILRSFWLNVYPNIVNKLDKEKK